MNYDDLTEIGRQALAAQEALAIVAELARLVEFRRRRDPERFPAVLQADVGLIEVLAAEAAKDEPREFDRLLQRAHDVIDHHADAEGFERKHTQVLP